jgi:hypothetical protein
MSFKLNLPDPEHILYATLAPCLQTFSALKPACRTWEDHHGKNFCLTIASSEVVGYD